MKFTIAAALLLGYAQSITLWTTTGEVAYEESDDDEATNVQLDDWHPGQHGTLGASEYTRVTPARFATDDDDIFMRSMIENYAIEKNCSGPDDPPTTCGKFTMNPATMRAAASEVLCTHKGLCGAALASYLDTYFDKAWGHFDVNKVGEVEVIKSPQFMRFLASDQYMSLQ
jgi:hypothetical protein